MTSQEDEELATFSCDLLADSKRHLSFLRELHVAGVSFQKNQQHAARRYLECWLPLVAQVQASHADAMPQLLPPPDVAWIWHVHRLAPESYHAYCLKHFGLSLEASPPFSFQTATDARNEAFDTQTMWRREYSQPFFLEADDRDDHASSRDTTVLADSLDLLEAADRQACFLWQVSGSNFADDDFLKDAVENYNRFLKLAAISPQTTLVPTYQIDLMWHTHMTSSNSGYRADCLRICGKAFDHDDSFNDRTPDGPLENAFEETALLWKEIYGSEYAVPGAMYRGEPPMYFFDRDWRPDHEFDASASLPPWIDPKIKGALDKNGRPVFIEIPREQFVAAYMPLYVAGAGSAGEGYYSLETNDAFVIMIQKLRIQETTTRNKIMQSKRALNWDPFRLVCGVQSPRREQELQELERRLLHYKNVSAFCRTRLYVSGSPASPVTPEDMARYGGLIPRDRRRPFDATGLSFLEPYSKNELTAAAGCGRVVPVRQRSRTGRAGGGGCGGGGCGGGCGG